MTVNEAIASASRLIGDGIDRKELTDWLSEIENTVVTEIAATHMGQTGDLSVINVEENGERQLFAPDPFSRLYVNYLLMKSDLAFRDIPQYMNSAAIFSEAYKSFADWYNRTHMPLGETSVKL